MDVELEFKALDLETGLLSEKGQLLCYREFCGALPVAAAKSLQSCRTLCDSIDGSPQGSPVPEILQARTLEWVAIAFGCWGAGKADLSILLSWSHGTEFYRSADFGGFLVSQKVAMVMITILQGWRTSPSVSSGKRLAFGELGDAADVGLCQPLSSCSQHLPPNKIF